MHVSTQQVAEDDDRPSLDDLQVADLEIDDMDPGRLDTEADAERHLALEGGRATACGETVGAHVGREPDTDSDEDVARFVFALHGHSRYCGECVQRVLDALFAQK